MGAVDVDKVCNGELDREYDCLAKEGADLKASLQKSFATRGMPPDKIRWLMRLRLPELVKQDLSGEERRAIARIRAIISRMGEIRDILDSGEECDEI